MAPFYFPPKGHEQLNLFSSKNWYISNKPGCSSPNLASWRYWNRLAIKPVGAVHSASGLLDVNDRVTFTDKPKQAGGWVGGQAPCWLGIIITGGGYMPSAHILHIGLRVSVGAGMYVCAWCYHSVYS